MLAEIVATLEFHLPYWLLAFFRLLGLFVLTPILSHHAFPRQIKILLALALSWVVYPALIASGALDHTADQTEAMLDVSLWTALLGIGNELINGMLFGYAIIIPLAAIQLGGHVIDQQLGLGLAQVYNPDFDGQAGISEQFLYIMTVTIFVMYGGLNVVFSLLCQSFHVIGLGQSVPVHDFMRFFIELMTLMMEVGLRVAAPLLCLIMLETVAMGFVARTMPQLNILSIGFALRILLGVALLISMVESTGLIFVEELSKSFGLLHELLMSQKPPGI